MGTPQRLQRLGGDDHDAPRTPAMEPTPPATHRRETQRPVAWSPRSVRQVLLHRATSRSRSSTIEHSTSETVDPAFTTSPVAVSVAFHTGRRKLILSSSVVNDSPSFSRLA